MATDEGKALPVGDPGAIDAGLEGSAASIAGSVSCNAAPAPQGSLGARGEEESCVEDSGLASPVVSGPMHVVAAACPVPYSTSEMDCYDSSALPHWVMEEEQKKESLEEVTREKKKGTRSRGTLVDEQVVWRKQDVIAKGHYKPWFPRFSRTWIPLGKPQCLLDLKSIASLVARAKPLRSYQRRDAVRPSKSCSEAPDLRADVSFKSARIDESDESHEEDGEVWAECESCNKWRRVPPEIAIDQEKSFFCTHLPDGDCSLKEEKWDEENFAEEEDDNDEEAGPSPGAPGSVSPPHAAPSTQGRRGVRARGGKAFYDSPPSKPSESACGEAPASPQRAPAGVSTDGAPA
eukprot:CAMPEP_0180153826 /NCGR_PEP_ID=MMETSP0986-20121125/23778_1 /TAXON_ID=697907 /ORGANISM="non described non described, Strain CCMP2293" /LENGTH=347 /DNA_ID=CAMNT_0022102031 /DNA_START=42 /DNA_END=1081 /DNA_ORIENTATION=-